MRTQSLLPLSLLLLTALPAASQQPADTPPAGEAPAAEQPREDDGQPPLLDLDALAAEDEEEDTAAQGRLRYNLRARPLHGLPAGMAAMMLGGQEGGQVIFSPFAAPMLLHAGAEGAEAKATVPLMVEIDGASLLGGARSDAAEGDSGTAAGSTGEDADELEVDVYAYAVTTSGGVYGYLSQRIVLDLEELGEAVYVGGVKFIGHLEVPPGAYLLRTLVHVPASQRFGLRTVDLEIPTGAAISPPFVAEPPAPWVLVAETAPQRRVTDAAGVVTDIAPPPTPDALLQRAGLPLPSALPVVRGERARFQALLYGAAGAALPKLLTTRLNDTEGQPVAELGATVEGRHPTELPGFERLELSLPLEGLDTGSYFLTLDAGQVGGRATVSPELGIVVLRGAGGPALWTDIQRQLRGEPQRAEVEIEDSRRGRRQQRVLAAVTDAYRTVLTALASGDRAGAGEDLLRIEYQVLDSDQENPLELLATAERGYVERLARVDPEALLPIVPLHIAAYQRYRELRNFGLATHSRQMAAHLAELYANPPREEPPKDEDEAARAERTRREEERRVNAGRLAADALAELGSFLQTAQVRVTGRSLLERALQLDPDNRFALINLAAGQEKTGDYRDAARTLQRLVEVDPKSPEGRVRLAVNLLRLGQVQEAASLLRRVIGENNPPWVLSLAYQELATLLTSQGRLADAVDLLEQGVGRLPDEFRLPIQLAYLLERAGHPVRAREALARLRPSPDVDSARHRYNRWPDAGGDDLRRTLDQAGLVRLPALSAALGRAPAPQGGRR